MERVNGRSENESCDFSSRLFTSTRLELLKDTSRARIALQEDHTTIRVDSS